MGTIVSKARLIVYATLQLSKTYDELKKRLDESPGLPLPSPTLPLWTVPATTIGLDPPDTLPEYADVVIIGSGITGTSFAYNALARTSGLSVVMLDAREVCSGATGRNGGHVNPPLYHDHAELSSRHGPAHARALIDFRLAHLAELLRVATAEGIVTRGQVRATEHLDVYTSEETFAEAKDKLAQWRAEMPEAAEGFMSYEREEAIKRFHLSEQTAGCITNPGGAMHPYRFVTSLLSTLLERHPDNFHIYARTPCTSITVSSPSAHPYTVHTPRGSIRATHVVHATNGWSSHLLPALRAKIVPVVGNMSAQRPGRALHPSTLHGARSFVFYKSGAGYDYLTQLPSSPSPSAADENENELMFGGGHTAQSYLAGALPQFFGLRNWGADASPPSPRPRHIHRDWGPGRSKAQWSGVLGISATCSLGERPGRRRALVLRAAARGEKAAGHRRAGEWIAAGYSGEGMVHAWMSGKALARWCSSGRRLAGWFPEILRVTEKRWREANVEELFARFM
ncbi:FAD dependent oxidoreductase [Epithele typhae]|uniref:FAD dependent oxidoreductase n=1 Tax=Epithele typhae TaxID=378194 RepID=UPI00200830D7|nr:FAD dependent oxidoreductase [Epithele typhae]KAH9939026.1 FAD dependent oxidoreductase [Epithele typhae]